MEFFGTHATAATWPAVGVLVAGVVDISVPSGGGQWVAMGPIMPEVTAGFGYNPEHSVIVEMPGDQLTNMVQPFWALPLLAIANLRARDIIGYTTVAMLADFVVCGWLTAFPAVI